MNRHVYFLSLASSFKFLKLVDYTASRLTVHSRVTKTGCKTKIYLGKVFSYHPKALHTHISTHTHRCNLDRQMDLLERFQTRKKATQHDLSACIFWLTDWSWLGIAGIDDAPPFLSKSIGYLPKINDTKFNYNK